MKNLIYWIHRIYYAFYCIAFVVGHYVFGKIAEYLILRPLFAWGTIRRMYEKRTGYTFEELLAQSEAWVENRTGGILMYATTSLFTFFAACTIYIIYRFTNSALGGVFSPIFEGRPLLATIALMAPPVIILETVLLKQDKYLEFFKSFDKDSLIKKCCYCTIILVLLTAEIICINQ